MSRVSIFLENKKKTRPAPVLLKGQDAADQTIRSDHESPSVVGFNNTEAERLDLKQWDEVKVAPEDTGNFFRWCHVISAELEKICSGRSFPTVGKLVALNREEVVLQVQGQGGITHVHFPRLGFTIRRAVKGKLWSTCCNLYAKMQIWDIMRECLTLANKSQSLGVDQEYEISSASFKRLITYHAQKSAFDGGHIS